VKCIGGKEGGGRGGTEPSLYSLSSLYSPEMVIAWGDKGIVASESELSKLRPGNKFDVK
jgi:hypothetical protein